MVQNRVQNFHFMLFILQKLPKPFSIFRDQAVMNEEGFVQIVGRSKDMIVRGGENVYPVEIEQCLFGHPKIQDVSVSCSFLTVQQQLLFIANRAV